MKTILLKFLVTRAGKWLKYPLSAGIASAATLLAKYHVELSPEQQLAVVGWLTLQITTLLNDWVNTQLSEGTKEIQQATGAKIDGYAGPETVRAVKIAVQSPARPLPRITGPGK